MVTQIIVRLLPPSNAIDTVCHFLASANDLFEHALQNLNDGDMVGITIHNRVNRNDKPIGNSFRRKNQLAEGVIRSNFEVWHSNSRFHALITLNMTVYSVRMPVAYGILPNRSKGRPLSVMARLKTSVIEGFAGENCLAHALIIAIAKAENYP